MISERCKLWLLLIFFRINLTFWDELAHIASQHVEKGQQIHVSGRLVSDTVESDEGKQQTYYKVSGLFPSRPRFNCPEKFIYIYCYIFQVVVQQLNFIQKSPSPVPLYNGDSNSASPGKYSRVSLCGVWFPCINFEILFWFWLRCRQKPKFIFCKFYWYHWRTLASLLCQSNGMVG